MSRTRTAAVQPSTTDVAVTHRTTEIDGYSIFYREAGRPGAPVILLPTAIRRRLFSIAT
jgi:hypothetical protein